MPRARAFPHTVPGENVLLRERISGSSDSRWAANPRRLLDGRTFGWLRRFRNSERSRKTGSRSKDLGRGRNIEPHGESPASDPAALGAQVSSSAEGRLGLAWKLPSTPRYETPTWLTMTSVTAENHSVTSSSSKEPSAATSCMRIAGMPVAWVEQLKHGSYARTTAETRFNMPSEM